MTSHSSWCLSVMPSNIFASQYSHAIASAPTVWVTVTARHSHPVALNVPATAHASDLPGFSHKWQLRQFNFITLLLQKRITIALCSEKKNTNQNKNRLFLAVEYQICILHICKFLIKNYWNRNTQFQCPWTDVRRMISERIMLILFFCRSDATVSWTRTRRMHRAWTFLRLC